MPNQLIALLIKLTAKTASLVSIRHSPGFGIAPEVMRRDARNASGLRVLLQELPDDLLAQCALRLIGPIHGAEHLAPGDVRRGRPRVDSPP